MISGLDLNQTVDYVLKNDKENPTVWKLGVVPSYVFARISIDGDKNQIESAYRMLQMALKGWDNFSVPYTVTTEKIYGRDIDVVPMSTLERIPLNVISELAMKVVEINQIGEIERKN